MPTIAPGSSQTINLTADQAVQVSTTGLAYVDLVSGAPGSPYDSRRVNVGVPQTFGPYGVAASIRVRAVDGALTHDAALLPSLTAQEVGQFRGLVSDARITTWANRAALVTAGLTSAFFTDVGIGGWWYYYSGGKWRPNGGRVILKNRVGSVTHNNTTRTVMDYVLLQAGLWQEGDILGMRVGKTLTGTDTDTTEIGLGTTAATFGENLNLSTASLTNANPQLSTLWEWQRLGATSVRPVSITGSVGQGVAGSVVSDPTITTNLDTTDAYLQVSGKLTTGGGPVTALRRWTVWLETGA